MIIRTVGAAVLLAALLVLLASGIAVAYPNPDATYPDGVDRTDCADCHGSDEADVLDPDSTSVRKGPHGTYVSGTDKCQTCHYVHDAPADATALLPAATVEDICNSCHDGTGGTGVYGVIKARTGVEPAATHRIGVTNVVPGGDTSGGSATVTFSGTDGTLTCTDCHSPHDSETVAPFLGDRLRSDATSDTAYTAASDRLLKQQPTGADAPVSEYGAAWCAGCHKGRLTQHSEDDGIMQDHPVMDDETYTYNELPVVTGVGEMTTELGSLGQSNRGYVMPGPDLTEPTEKTTLQEGYAPICQQCHEDARDVGPSARETNPTLTSADQEFSVTTYGGDSSDNPQFQTFPHESDNANFLVREPETDEPYALCLNCHSIVHDAVPGSDYVTIFEPGQHDDALDGYPNEPYVVWTDCTICHATDLNAVHAQQCQVCHSSPYDTLTALGGWDNSCQQGGCHETIHDGVGDAHDPWADPYGGGQCSLCHVNPGFTLSQTKCVNCHTLYSASDTTPPVTSTETTGTYDGAIVVEFSITDSGKVGIGTTFYKIDGGETQVGGSFVISEPGDHTVEFWSIDQAGNVETTTKTASFTITADTTPPVTTSNATTTYYYYPAYITLTATDASTMGVKNTYYRLDGGATQTGTFVTVPAPTGIFPHTLEFWSEDYSGNVETTKTANFTIIGGTGTLRFPTDYVVGDGEWVEWLIWKGARDATPDYTIYHDGPWVGTDEIQLPVSATQYYVLETWGTPTMDYDEYAWGYYSITVPGAVVPLQ